MFVPGWLPSINFVMVHLSCTQHVIPFSLDHNLSHSFYQIEAEMTIRFTKNLPVPSRINQNLPTKTHTHTQRFPIDIHPQTPYHTHSCHLGECNPPPVALSPSPTSRISPPPPPLYALPSPLALLSYLIHNYPPLLISPSHMHHQQGMPPFLWPLSGRRRGGWRGRGFHGEQSARETKNERALN